MSYSYVVTSQKATAVNHAIVCNFTSSDNKNLILAKGNYLLVYAIKNGTTELVLECPLFGKIKCLEYYRPSTATTDSLFVLTERKSFCVLGYDQLTNKLITRAVGNVRDRAGRDVEIGQRGLVDPDFRMIGMMLYEGHLKVIPVEANGMKEAVNIALDETRIIDIKFLHGCSRPTVCMLYQDNRQIRHVKTLHVEVREKDSSPGPWSQSNVEYGASHLIPVPAPIGGVLVVGASSITYIGQTTVTTGGEPSTQMHVQAVEIAPTLISASVCISEDGSRFLLADHRGVLSVVVLRTGPSHEVLSLVIDTLGTTSIAENLTYLGDGLVFVGSIFGDSQLIRLHPQKDAEGSNAEVLALHPNIGPIKDMCLVDNDKQGGQRQLVTCSGAYKDGSLRVIRSGIGLQEQASLEVGGIKGLWSLRTREDAAFDKYLVQSFIGETRVLAIENEEMGEIEIDGFSSQEPTLYCANMQGGALVQVTARSVRLVNSESFALLSEYVAPRTITVASGTLTQVTLALSGGEVHYLEIDASGRNIALVSTTKLDQDIACVSLRPLSNTSVDSPSTKTAGDMEVDTEPDTSATLAASSIIAIAMWTDNSIRLHALPTLEEICRVQLGTDTQARDILLITLGGKSYLLVGLGDGRLITYSVDFSSDLPSLTNKRNGVLGTHRITFSVFTNAGAICVFAACDRPTIMYSKNGKILFSVLDVNQTEFTNMAPFHSELFPNCLALSSDASLLIGVIEDIQKVHIQTIALNQNPRRITHSPVHSVYGVTAEKTSLTVRGEVTRSRVLFFEDGNLAQIGVYELDPLEQGISITTCTFDNEALGGQNPATGGLASPAPGVHTSSSSSSASPGKAEYFVVGTAHVINGESEPSRGRILVFEISDRQVFLIAEKEVRGAVYSLAQTSGRLVAGVGSKVSIYNLTSSTEDLSSFTSQPELSLECSHTSQIMTLFLKTKGDTILVGDLVRSMTVLHYSALEKKLQEVARDFHSSYLRAVEILDGATEDIYVGTDIHGNVQCMRQQTDATTDEERNKLEGCGEFSVGEYLNCFRRGSLVGQPIDSSDSTWHSNVKSPSIEKRDSGILSSNYHTITGLRAGTSSVLYGGVSGAVGNVIALSEESYKFFAAVERVMKRVVVSIGGLNHRDWRCLQNDLRTAPQRNMVDGDLVELLLELSRAELESATREINDELTLVFGAPAGPSSGTKASSTSTSSHSKANTGAMLIDLSAERVELTPEDIIHRVEDISRLH